MHRLVVCLENISVDEFLVTRFAAVHFVGLVAFVVVARSVIGAAATWLRHRAGLCNTKGLRGRVRHCVLLLLLNTKVLTMH